MNRLVVYKGWIFPTTSTTITAGEGFVSFVSFKPLEIDNRLHKRNPKSFRRIFWWILNNRIWRGWSCGSLFVTTRSRTWQFYNSRTVFFYRMYIYIYIYIYISYVKRQTLAIWVMALTLGVVVYRISSCPISGRLAAGPTRIFAVFLSIYTVW